MIDKIIRLAEINSAEGIIGQNHIGDELRKERKEIANELVNSKIIVLTEDGGFQFIGENKKINRDLYLDTYHNF